jgi:BirA family biotin operon repressor/biotin-[acetyl-CoA-carboxylase] ligase
MPGRDGLDPDKISQNLRTKRIGKNIVVFSSTSSTNDIAAEYAKNKTNDGLVILAEKQTKGRGRAGNKWLSGHGDSIICSIVLTDYKLNPELLSLACAVAVAEAIGRCAKSHAKIKWPNDIILNGKKVAGILVESRKIKNRTAYVIGVGINCHQTKSDFPAELQPTATSIDIETGGVANRISLIRRLLTSLDHWLTITEKSGQKVIERWQKLNTQLHHRVVLVYNRRRFVGNCIGIDPEKGLILQLDSGAARFFPAAQTSIQK